MKNEEILKLIKYALNGDVNNFTKVVDEIANYEEKKRNFHFAKAIKKILEENLQEGKKLGNMNISTFIPRDNEKGFKLLSINEYFYSWEDIILSKETEESLKNIVEEIINEELLLSYGLKPKQKILFYGEPGTGKTFSAKVLSSILNYPLVYVNFEAVISSFLGETSANLKKVFNFIEQGRWVVLFDEFDIIGKKRDDDTEHGEIKRVVNNLMLLLENYKGNSLIIASTNHPKLLDIGVWRRFDDVIYFDLPDKKRREKLFKLYLKNFPKEKNVDYKKLSEDTKNFSCADINQICIDAIKRCILNGKSKVSVKDIETSIKLHKKKYSAINKV